MKYTLRVLGGNGFHAVAVLEDKQEAKLLIWYYLQNLWTVHVRLVNTHSVHNRFFSKEYK